MIKAADYIEIRTNEISGADVVFSGWTDLVVFHGLLPMAVMFRDAFVGNLDRIITQAKGE